MVDIVWGSDKPPRPNEKIRSLGLEHAGKTSEEKITELRKELEKKKSAGLIICECSWIGHGILDLVLTIFR